MTSHEIADQYFLWGLSVVPVRHGTKFPFGDWKRYQDRPADQTQIDRWFKDRDLGLGVVCGDVSGGLVCLDFDTPDAYDAFIATNPLAQSYPTAESHRGKHVFFRSTKSVPSHELYVKGIEGKAGDVISNRKFVVLPPTVHPEGTVRKWLVPMTKEIPFVDFNDLDLGTAPNGKRKLTATSDDDEEDVFTKPVFPVGTRHNSLMRMALEFNDLDLSLEAIDECIHQTNAVRCEPPLPDWEVDGIIRHIAQKRETVRHLSKGIENDDALEEDKSVIPNIFSKEDDGTGSEELYGDYFVSAPDYSETMGEDFMEWLVEGMIPLSFITVIGATSKSGKSCLATNLAHCVATGTPFLGLPTPESAVLWVAYEESERERMMVLADYRPLPANLFITHERIILNTKEGLEALRFWIRKTNAKLVVIDPLYSAVSIDSMTDGRKTRASLDDFKQLCRTENICALILHHFTKNTSLGSTRERFADSNQVLAIASMDWIMETKNLHDETREIRLVGAGRGKVAQKTWVIFSESQSKFELVASGTAEEVKREHMDREILDALSTAASGMTADDIAESLSAPVRGIKNRLTQMRKDNKITIIGKVGNANVYGCDRELLTV